MIKELMGLPWYKKMEVLRAIKGWSQREAAEKCCTNHKSYWGWETGKCYPRKNSQKAIAQAFGVSLKEIFSTEEKTVIKGF